MWESEDRGSNFQERTSHTYVLRKKKRDLKTYEETSQEVYLYTGIKLCYIFI